VSIIRHGAEKRIFSVVWETIGNNIVGEWRLRNSTIVYSRMMFAALLKSTRYLWARVIEHLAVVPIGINTTSMVRTLVDRGWISQAMKEGRKEGGKSGAPPAPVQ